jgi:hypothetical protein
MFKIITNFINNTFHKTEHISYPCVNEMQTNFDFSEIIMTAATLSKPVHKHYEQSGRSPVEFEDV